MGQRHLRFARPRLRCRHAPKSELASGAHGLDLLLVASRGRPRREPPPVARQGLGLLERSHPERSGSRASRHSSLRVAHRYHAHGPRHGAPGRRLPGIGRTETVGQLQRWKYLVRQLRPERHLYFRGSPIPWSPRRGTCVAGAYVDVYYALLASLSSGWMHVNMLTTPENSPASFFIAVAWT